MEKSGSPDAEFRTTAQTRDGTRVVHLGCGASANSVYVVDDALPAQLAREVYKFTLDAQKSWGTYVSLEEVRQSPVNQQNVHVPGRQDATAADIMEAAGHELACRVVRSVWLGGHDSAEKMLNPELQLGRVHGFAVWANSGRVGEECAYHIDFAELHWRRSGGEIYPPLFASTVHVSEVDENDMSGGVFGVNTGGLDHYARFGHKGMLLHHVPGAVEADWNTDQRWVKVGYNFRRAILFGGALPHRATTLESMPVGMQRVVVGINVFDTTIGPSVAPAPIHSLGYSQALAKLQALRPVLGEEQWGDAYALVPLEGRYAKGAEQSCVQCGKTMAVQLEHNGRCFCGASCVKIHKKAKS